jgi:hypothetical protein
MNIVTTELPDGDPGVPYSETIEARGGTSQYTYTLHDGTLPDGLTLDENTGVLSGTPSTGGIYDFTIRCTDSTPYTDDQEYTVIIGIIVHTEEDEVSEPSRFALVGNYPNPFNNSTVIRFRLGEPAQVRLEVFSLLGQKIATLIDSRMDSGEHEISWNTDAASSGVYFYRLTAGSENRVRKMTLIK